MKKIQLISIIITAFQTLTFAQASHIITTSGYTFVPNTVNANVGDTIIFNVDFSMHPLQQVSSATWAADQSTALAGGFSNSTGNSYSVIMTQPGTVYYVCKMHVASHGMKGQISVAGSNGVDNVPSATTLIYPNPADKQLSISPGSHGYFTFSIIDMFGRTVSESSAYAGAKDVFVANVSAIAEGDYILIVNTLDGKTSRSKIAIRH